MQQPMVYTYWAIDVGERIQQLSDERASHIVIPAIHKLRGDVA